MIINPEKLQTLIEEYRRLSYLHGYSSQQRGQRFNHFLAEMFQCWGIDASSNIRGDGEIDVGFEFAGRRFVLEAKWEESPIGTGTISKLQKRIRQHLSGTIGLFLSMSGYTREALNDLKQGEQLSVLLLSKEHFDSMLSGFVPPSELLNRHISRASLFGDAFPSLLSLFEDPNPDKPEPNRAYLEMIAYVDVYSRDPSRKLELSDGE